MTHNKTRKRENSTISVEDVGFFEGAEKLLEMWFSLQPRDRGDEHGISSRELEKGLRVIPRSRLEELLSLVHCKIISQCSSETMDAYLLSESSLYVSKNRFILKTCGTTTLLHAIEPLIAMVEEVFPRAVVMVLWDIFYSHRNFLKPHLQPHPHHSFEEEAMYLDRIFENGAAYALGKLNGDAWYLYTMESAEHPLEVPDQTLEILMMDLDPTFMTQFCPEAYSSAEELTASIGLRDLFPGAILDGKIFDPCGYSLNAIVKDDTYFTVHVTPQQECSFVSFETNLEEESYDTLIAKVLDLFQPGRCTLTLFASKLAKCGLSYLTLRPPKIRNYQCKDRQFSEFNTYNLSFAHYSRAALPTPNGIA